MMGLETMYLPSNMAILCHILGCASVFPSCPTKNVGKSQKKELLLMAEIRPNHHFGYAC